MDARLRKALAGRMAEGEMYCANCTREIADNSNFCYVCGARQTVAPQYRPVYPKRLTRSVTDCKLAGVCGGMAEYWGMDSTVVRLLWVLAVLFTVPFAIVGYFVAWIVMPRGEVPVQVVAAQPVAAPAANTMGQ